MTEFPARVRAGPGERGPDLPGTADQRRRAVHVRICILVGVWSSLFCVLYVVIAAPWLLIVISAVSTSLGLYSAIAMSRGMSLRRAGTLSVLGMFGMCAPTPFYYGGVDFAGNAWLLAVPLAAMSMRNFRSGIATTVGLVVVCCASFAMERAGVLPEPIVGERARTVLALVNLPVTGILLLTIGRMHDLAVRARTERVKAANAELRVEIARRVAVQEDLERTRAELINAARFAGRAEVATGALHNIGNALTSLTVSTARAHTMSRQLKSQRLLDLAVLLDGHEDPRMAGFTRKLAEEMERTREALEHELQAAVTGAEHVASVVSVQQEHARYGGMEEEVTLVDEVRRAMTLVGLTDGVMVQGAATVTVDRHRLLQILGNLLKNAKDAVGDRNADAHIEVVITPGERVQVSVRDNGVGIELASLERIFAHGFTTKAHGSGFGLHASALAARELGGTLTAASDGPGKGACFTLTLPHHPPTVG